ncbi:histidinol-phosphatase [bacterium]|nr:MAG: histidinol-phosphatase [bacterium]
MKNPPELLEYVGVIHIHTTDSDGTKSHEKIISIAQKYHIDFLMFADHMTLKSKDKEGWHDRTLVIIGYEHEDAREWNHYLVFGLDEPLPKDLSPKQYVRKVRRAGGIGIIAHPDEKRDFPEHPPLPWTEWSTDEFDGIEIWNHMSAWLEGIAAGNKLKYLLNPRALLISPPEETLKRWDKLARRRKIVGIASADAHGYRQKIFGPIWRTIFPYRVELRSLRTHILTKEPLSKDFDEAKKQVFSALRHCNVFMSNYRWGDATGFRFWAQTSNSIAGIGEKIPLHRRLRFFVKSPGDAKIRLIRNGEFFAEVDGEEAIFAPTKPGVYRVELYRNGKGWIFSNHITVVETTFRGKGNLSGKNKNAASGYRKSSGRNKRNGARNRRSSSGTGRRDVKRRKDK